MKEIVKVGLLLVENNSFLVTRKRNTRAFLIPGGRHEGNENDTQALEREILEELSCQLDAKSLQYIGDFRDVAANEPDSYITVKLYSGKIIGNPIASSEIEELKWFNPEVDDVNILARSVQNKILPYLLDNNYL
jgi:8-oxo-dGTP diphosphatase